MGAGATLRDIVAALEKIYTRSIGFEFKYIRDPKILDWFQLKVERDSLAFTPGVEYKKRILKKLNEAVVFENFLHTKFLGQKRFSLEGGETRTFLEDGDEIVMRAWCEGAKADGGAVRIGFGECSGRVVAAPSV